MYFSSLFPYVVLICFLVRALLLKGSLDGIRHMFTPKVTHCGPLHAAYIQTMNTLCRATEASQVALDATHTPSSQTLPPMISLMRDSAGIRNISLANTRLLLYARKWRWKTPSFTKNPSILQTRPNFTIVRDTHVKTQTSSCDISAWEMTKRINRTVHFQPADYFLYWISPVWVIHQSV